MASRNAAKENVQDGDLLLVIHDFVARSEDELSLAKGDRIELIEKDDEFGDGWYLGRHMGNARTGLFPEVYTTPAPKGNFANAVHNRRRSDGPPQTPQSSEGVGIATSPQSSRFPSDQRPASSSGPQQSAASPMAQMAMRTSLPSAASHEPITTASPVMSETLSVIDEHMNDMSSPGSSFMNGGNREAIETREGATPQPLQRFSYIAGHETDEEEQDLHTEAEVMAWTPDRVAEYLEDKGVEKPHCDVFRDQEISGEVLLAMEQSSIFLKEFDLGSVGRRLKTWHKIRALQDETRANAPVKAARSTSQYSARSEDANGDASRNRASTVGSILPRALDTSRHSVGSATGVRSSTLQSLTSQAAAPTVNQKPTAMASSQGTNKHESTHRPSAQHIREMQHSRRHSSIDSTSDSPARQSHRKQPSIDQQWQPGQLQTNGSSTTHSKTLSSGSTGYKSSSILTSPSSPADLDRGYFSSNELDSRSRTSKGVLSKKTSLGPSPMHSRNSSYAQQAGKRRSTTGRVSTGSSRDSSMGQGIFSAISSVGNTLGSMRSATAPQAGRKAESPNDALSPIVTKLDHREVLAEDQTKNSSSPTGGKMSFFQNKPKMAGLRTISDAITRTEKVTATTPSPIKENMVSSPVRTGSTTPSTDTRSFDLQKSEVQSRTSENSGNNLAPPVANPRRMMPRTKKNTSAYTRGLEKKTPKEQMIGCDYSGWMKKKSGSLMTTWKPRLFVLRGRRLSYYYSDTDTEEKGLIDISFHRVLPAHNETLQGLHATMTGAMGSPTIPQDGSTSTAAEADLKLHPATDGDKDIFIFKLVPPKSGLAKGVNFTRPTVHYFAVNSRQEGRYWMAALMKATIDRDEASGVTTSYNQKTISLAKARARKERPPALMDGIDGDEPAELAGDGEVLSQGLGIVGLGEKGGGEAVGGAEMEAASAEEVVDEKAGIAS